jgi:hypothetical protein
MCVSSLELCMLHTSVLIGVRHEGAHRASIFLIGASSRVPPHVHEVTENTVVHGYHEFLLHAPAKQPPCTQARSQPSPILACLPFPRMPSCRYPADRVPLCTRLKRSGPQLQICSRCQRALALPRATRHRAHHPPEVGSGVTTCPMAQSAPPTRKGLRCCHVP